MQNTTGRFFANPFLPSIFTRLMLVIFAIMIPALLGLMLLLNHFYERERAQLKLDAMMTARALRLAVDRDLTSCKIAALALANSDHLAIRKFDDFHRQAQAFLGDDFPGFTFVLSDANGQQLLNTVRPYGAPLPRHGNPAQLRRVFEQGRPVISDLYSGDVVGRPLIGVDVPVWRDNRVIYDLSVGILPERLGKVLAEQHLPAERIAAVLDSQGVIVARTHDAQKFIGKKALTALTERIAFAIEGEYDGVTVDGIPVYSAFSRSDASGWTVVIGIPKSKLLAERMQSIVWLCALALLLLLGGLALAWHFGSGITHSVRALAVPLPGGASMPQMAFREAEDVAAELSQYRNHLEQLVCERTNQLELASQKLAESQRMILAVIDANPGLAAYWDADLRCRFANRNYQEWFGKAPQDMIGMRLQDLLGVELFALNEAYLRRALAGEPQEFERTLTKTSGEIRHSWISYIPDHDAEGNVHGIFVVVTDVTALKKAEEDQRIAATAFNIHEAMIITDADLLILRVNPAYTEATGYAQQEVVGKLPHLFQSELHDPAYFSAMWECLHRCGSWEGELMDRRKNGEIYPIWFTITGVNDPDGRTTHFVCTQLDITVRKAAEEEIKNMAYFDPLTGLPNRRLMMDRLRSALASSQSSGGGAVMFLDLDNFKQLNDTCGHDQGDLLLQQVALRLVQHARPGNTVARLGGDEFVVVLEGLASGPGQALAEARAIGEELLAALSEPYYLGSCIHHCTASIGVTLFGQQRESIGEVLKQADIAMYQAKGAGRNGVHFFQRIGS